METAPPIVWALVDDRPGNAGQCLGVAEKLGLPFTIKPVRYTQWGNLPNLLRRDTLLGVRRECSAELCAPWPQLAISTGRRSAPVALWLKKQSPTTKLAHIMNPDFGHERFDLLVLPSHDEPSSAPNQLVLPAAPHRLTHATLEAAAMHWRSAFQHLPRPWVTVIVGGDTKTGRFTATQAQALGRSIAEAVQAVGGSVLLTTSRRTNEAAEGALTQALAHIPSYRYDWRDGGENPYHGLLALGDFIVGTGDSISMLSEAAFTGKPLYVADESNALAPKHRRFHQWLYNANAARPWRNQLATYSPATLDGALDVAQAIRERLLLSR